MYNDIEREKASFLLYDIDYGWDYDRPRLIRGITMEPDDVPEEVEYQDIFWMGLDEEDEITELEFDPKLIEQKKNTIRRQRRRSIEYKTRLEEIRREGLRVMLWGMKR